MQADYEDETVSGTKKIAYSVKVHKRVSLNRKSHRCSDEEGRTYQACHRDYMEKKMDCRLPWFKGGRPLRPCDQPQDLHTYREITAALLKLNQVELLAEVACVIPCTEYGYTISKEMEKMFYYEDRAIRSHQYVFTIDDSQVEVIRERWIYTIDNLVADIGGYLGLLLGSSILNIYEQAVFLLRKLYKNIRKV